MKTINFSAVSETLFLPLYSRAIETESENPIITDPVSIELIRTLDKEFADTDSAILRAMVRRRLPKRLPVSMALRTRAFDRFAARFIGKHPDAIIINLGCGLDTRFSRVDNGSIDWYNIDLPPVISLRNRILPPRPRERNLPFSVLDIAWMKEISTLGRPVFIYAEGLLMYLTEESVRDLLLELQQKFPGSELVAEVFNRNWIHRLRHPLIRRKFRRQLHMSDDTLFTFGISDSRDFESINTGFKFIDDWSYFDDREKKLGWYNLFGSFNFIRKMQWTVHYRIGIYNRAETMLQS